MKTIVAVGTVFIILIILKFTMFPSTVGSELIPDVTNQDYLIFVESNSSLGEYILSDSFAFDVSADKVKSNSEIYVTNDTDGETLFHTCCNAFISHGYEHEHEEVIEDIGRFTGVFRNDSRKIIFNIYDNEEVEEFTGYNLVLVVNKGRL